MVSIKYSCVGNNIIASRNYNAFNAISNSTNKSILLEVETACVFSIFIDTIFDISRQEQVFFIVRYVNEIIKYI